MASQNYRPSNSNARPPMPSAWSAQIYGDVQPMEAESEKCPGLFRLLVVIFLIFTIGAAVFPK